MSKTKETESAYRIGAVSRLTEVPSDTLRVWERRYGVVEPRRTDGGSRLYNQHDVARLTLIKRLVDAGHAIGTVANLDLEQLQERVTTIRQAKSGKTASAKGPVNVMVLGATLPVRLNAERAAIKADGLRISGAYLNDTDFERAAGSVEADILVVELPTLNQESVAKVRRMQRRCGARRLVVVYGFARQLLLAQLEEQRVTALRFPVRWDQLRRACCPTLAPAQQQAEASDFEAAQGATIPARLFDDTQLARASTASTTIRCECPHHIADLILALARFEQYSAECENRNRDDRELHAYLHVTSARARLMLEEALVKVIEVEGISLDEPAGNATSA